MYRHAGPLHLSAEDMPQPTVMNSEQNVENCVYENDQIEPVPTSKDAETMETSVENNVKNILERVDSLQFDG